MTSTDSIVPKSLPTPINFKTVMAIEERETNADMIVDLHRLGYLLKDMLVLDATYGKGTFWRKWQPFRLVMHDLKLDGVDFTNLPYDDFTFDAVVFDPPYKLNGTPDPMVDERYGVDEPTAWRARLRLMREGAVECLRVVKPKGWLFVKCQDQVCSGEVRWQTDMITETLEAQRRWEAPPEARKGRVRKVDHLLFPSYREQPDGRGQEHARRNYSSMLVFRKVG